MNEVERRIKHQIDNNIAQTDLKIDLVQYMSQSKRAKDYYLNQKKQGEEFKHQFRYEVIGEQDALLMQVPNINESGYYAGVVALKSYVDKFHSDLNVEIIDPVIDYFYLHPPNKESEFFQMFNTYARQGEWEELLKFQEIHDMCNGFIFKYIDKCKPAFFGLSIIDGNIDASLAIASLIKKEYPHIKILMGGNGIEVLDFGLLPNSKYTTIKYDFVDVFSRGDGEATFVEILKCDMSDESLAKIKGIVWRKSTGEHIDTPMELTHNPSRENIDMNKLPMPDYSSLEENYYYHSTYQYSVPLVLSRGCPYRCTFCSVPEFIPVFRYRTHESVLEEMEYWVNKGRKSFFMHDSIINGNPKWLMKFCEMIIDKWGEYQIDFGGNMRLQNVMRDLDTMWLFRRAGLSKMITGFESASEPVLKHMKKYTSMEGVREIFDNVRTINKVLNEERPFAPKMQFAMQLIIGYLNETREDFQRTVDFVKEYNDCMSEILTCSAFLLHTTLQNKWIEEGEPLIQHRNSVIFDTMYNTTQDRLNWLNEIEQVFKDYNLPYSIYNRGIFHELMKENETAQEHYTWINKKLFFGPNGEKPTLDMIHEELGIKKKKLM